MSDYSVFFIPAAQVEAANVVMAMINGDDILVSFSFSRPAVPDDGPANATATYYYGGMDSTPAWLAAVVAAATSVPTPSGGWPTTGSSSGTVTQAAAQAAAQAIYLNTGTRLDGVDPDPGVVESAALQALHLQQYSIFG